MEARQFYLTLPSNSSMKVFPDNTLASYKVKLPEHITLTGSWQAGLASITYPHTWYDITANNRRFYYQNSTGFTDVILLPEGYYNSVQDLVDKMNQGLTEEGVKGVSLTYDNLSRKVTLTLAPGMKFLIPKELSLLLGLDKKAELAKTTTAPFVSDLNIGRQSLFVYLNVVEDQIVGDVRAPLLRTVPVQGKKGDTITINYESPQFQPIATKEFETLEILITDDTGEKIPFERGRVVVTLIFQRSPIL